MSEYDFGWEEDILDSEDTIISDEIEGADELSLTNRLFKVINIITKECRRNRTLYFRGRTE